MSFDKPTRNLLAKMTAAARDRLAEDIAAQFQSTYGLYPDGSRLDVARTPEDRHAATELRALLDHFESAEPEGKTRQANAYQRLVREIGFTLLNRLAALRLCEERGLVIECVRSGMNSGGFQLYDRLAGGALGNRYQTYRAFIEGMFDELAADLGALFDRSTPQSVVFPSEPALNDVLALLNDTELTRREIWQQDETIGWIYQYYNDPAERKKMRDESQAPRTSRELAVRNQFFTPRYVVEFLTDNTLGRTWYEMRRGDTKLIEHCRYLVRRKHPIFLPEGQDGPLPYDPVNGMRGDPDLAGDMWVCPNPEIEDIDGIFRYALTVGGYDYTRQHLGVECSELANSRLRQYQETGIWEGSFEELRCCLFFEQRRYHHFGRGPEGDEEKAILALYQAICKLWDREVDDIPYRAKKDPRRMRVLDPACGSGHFLLYSFDLFQTIYSEAYDDPDLSLDLHDSFPDRTDYLRQVPQLILENNLHGIDIDPRAAQIAALALWLRAQRAWQAQKLDPVERPTVGRTHIVVAEPMPGDEGLLEEFVSDLPKDQHPEIIGPLVRTIFDKMKLAGEAGSLLKIEKELKDAVEQACADWMKAPRADQLSFLPGQPKPKQLGMDLSGVTDESFWQQAEGLVLYAMEDYARQAENGKGMRRRLFAGDAAQGFAFIDLCRKHYDVVLMNPPFGDPTKSQKDYLIRNYKGQPTDLYACFVERFLTLTNWLGAITSRSFLNFGSFLSFREKVILPNSRMHVLADFGLGIMDSAMVRSAVYVLETKLISKKISIFLNLLNDLEKQQSLLAICYKINKGEFDKKINLVPQTLFSILDQKPFAYWAGQKLLQRFSPKNSFSEKAGSVVLGAVTSDNDRFLRLRWEVPILQISEIHWSPYPKGGDFLKYFKPINLVINWSDSGKIIEYAGGNAVRLRDVTQYFRPGLTYSLVNEFGFFVCALPDNCVFDNTSPTIFPYDKAHLLIVLGLTNTRPFEFFIRCLTDSRHWQVGYVRQVPWPTIDDISSPILTNLSYQAIRAQRIRYALIETTSEFLLPGVLYIKRKETLKETIESVIDWDEDRIIELIKLDHEIDKLAYKVYQLDNEEKKIITKEIGIHIFDFPCRTISIAEWNTAQKNSVKNIDVEDGNKADIDLEDGYERRHRITLSYLESMAWKLQCRPDLVSQFRRKSKFINQEDIYTSGSGLVSYTMGVYFGRWDIRIATKAKSIPSLTDPFASLPICPPGMLQNDEGHPITPSDLPPDYPLLIPWDGILVDDPGLGEHPEPHEWDILRGVERVLQLLWPENHESTADEACQILGVKDLREYFRKPSAFFADHLKRYSKSRRQAPIYWSLSTDSGSYTLWIYYHRLTGETLYTAVNRYVSPKIEQVERYLSRLEDDLSKVFGRSAGELRDKVDAARTFLAELNDFRAELLRVAELPYQPDLNDGVIINAAPLYKLFRLTKWSKDCQAVWKKLEEGEYDWAHMAYVLWPDRVREKCKNDKSLAIAHGVEELYQGVEKVKKGKRRLKVEEEQEELGFG